MRGFTEKQEADNGILATLDKAAVSYQVVLTKSDHVTPPELAACVAELQAMLKRHAAAFPDVVVTSARSGLGIRNCAQRCRCCASGLNLSRIRRGVLFPAAAAAAK